MKVTHKQLTTALVGTLLIAGAATADSQKKSNADPAKAGVSSESASAVATAATAMSLVRYGDANKDALALITAARLLKQAGSSNEKLQAQSGVNTPAKTAEDARTVESLLARARTYAAGDVTLVALADDVARSGSRGAVGGPKQARSVVGSRSRDSYKVTFREGEPARVLVSGDGDSDLDLFIYDENGNLVCKDDDATDDMICGWTPRWTGRFTIRIVNLGVANEYIIMTN